VIDLTFAAGGEWLVGCGTGGVSIWNARTGRVVRRLGGGDGADYRRLHLTPDNRILSVVASLNPPSGDKGPVRSVMTVRQYDVLSGQEIRRFPLPELSGSWDCHTVFSADGKSLYGGEGHTVVGYDLATGWALWHYVPQEKYFVKGIAVSQDGRTVAVNSDDPKGDVRPLDAKGQVRLLDAKTGKVVGELPVIEGGAGVVGFSGDGQSLATLASRDGRVAIWSRNPLSRQMVLGIDSHPDYPPVFSPDDTTVAVWGWFEYGPPTLHFFDTATGICRCILDSGRYGYGKKYSSIAAFSPDGAVVALGGEGEITLWDTRTGQRSPLSPESSGIFGWRFDPQFSPDDRQLIHTQVEGDDLVVLDLIAGREVERKSRLGRHSWEFKRPASRSLLNVRSADGRFKTIDGGLRESIAVIDTVIDKEVARIPIPYREYAVAFSLDGKQLCTCDGSTVRVYDIATRKQILDLGSRWRPKAGGSEEPWGFVSPDGRHLAVIDHDEKSSSKTVTFLSTTTWRSGRTVPVNWADEFRWSGSSLFTIHTRDVERVDWFQEDRVCRVAEWDVVSGCVSTRKFEFPRNCCRTLSANGRMLAVCNDLAEDGTYPIRIFEVESGRERCRFVSVDPCATLSFSPGGRYLLAHHPGVPYILWDVRGRASATAPSDAELELAWTDLASDDAAAAFRAIRLLADFPERSVPLLRAKLPPATAPDPAVVAKLIAALGSDEFSEREDAQKELERLGKPVAPALREVVKTSASPEVLRRATELLGRLWNKPPDGPQLVSVRAVEAVGWMDTAEAVRLLEVWASGAEGNRLTAEAKAALDRRNAQVNNP
jgi:WD40 repeat protein